MDGRNRFDGGKGKCPWLQSSRRILLAAVVTLGSSGISFGAGFPQGKEASRNTLRDIEFIDAATGWAVGDRGTILRTHDGGRSWLECGTAMPLSPTQTRPDANMQRVLDQVRVVAGTTDRPVQQTILKNADCRLNSVSFVDPVHGWAVGGNLLPGVESSRGTILITDNGGQTWSPISNAGMPHLYRIDMENLARGWGIGRSGHLHRGGYYETEGAGRSWSSAASRNSGGNFVDGDRIASGYVAVDEAGQLYRVQNSRTIVSTVIDRSARPVRKVRMTDSQNGWAVGDGGTVLMTTDGGQSWRGAPVPEEFRQSLAGFDFQALHVTPAGIRFAGSPGTHIFTLDPAASKLTAAPTGTSATLYDLDFSDESNGWGAGANETILHTTDGGKSWNIQRGGAANLAVLAIAFEDNDAGWEMLARYARDERLATGVVQVLLDPANSASSAGVAEAAERLGVLECSTVAGWTLVPRGQPDMDHIRRQLISVIRQTRPQVVTCNRSAITMPDGTMLDTHTFLDAVIRSAATEDNNSRSTLAGTTGPWQCLRLATSDPVTAGDWIMDSSTWLTHSGQSVADQAMISRALAGLGLTSPGRQAWRIKRYNQARSGATSEGLFQNLGTGLDRRFLMQDADRNSSNLADISRAMQKDSELAKLASFQCSTHMDLVVWRSQVSSWVTQTSAELGGVWLVQLSAAAFRQGNLQLASEALNHLVSSNPRHALAPAAALWLARYVASEETRIANDESIRPWGTASPIEKLLENQMPATTSEPAVVKDANGIEHLVWVPSAPGTARVTGDEEASAIRQVAAITADDLAIAPEVTSKQHWQAVAGRLSVLSSNFPELGSMTDMTLAQANTVRKSSGWEAAKSLYQQLIEVRQTRPEAGLIALRERKISENPPDQWESCWPCPTTPLRPELDGSLDDELWTGMFAHGEFKMVSMQQPGNQQPAKTDYLLVSADDKFLYLAGRCSRLPGQSKSAPVGTRVRDALADNIDRIVVGFDIDRDGAWPLWLGIGSDGRIADGCGASRAWNPQWFVATGLDDDTAWTFELAIAWDQLGQSGPPGATEPWGLGLERFAANTRVNLWDCPGPAISEQTFSLSTPSAGIQGYTLLQFGADK